MIHYTAYETAITSPFVFIETVESGSTPEFREFLKTRPWVKVAGEINASPQLTGAIRKFRRAYIELLDAAKPETRRFLVSRKSLFLDRGFTSDMPLSLSSTLNADPDTDSRPLLENIKELFDGLVGKHFDYAPSGEMADKFVSAVLNGVARAWFEQLKPPLQIRQRTLVETIALLFRSSRVA